MNRHIGTNTDLRRRAGPMMPGTPQEGSQIPYCSNGFQRNSWVTCFEEWPQSRDESVVLAAGEGLVGLQNASIRFGAKTYADGIFCGKVNFFGRERFYLVPAPGITGHTDSLLIDFNSLTEVTDAAPGNDTCRK